MTELRPCEFIVRDNVKDPRTGVWKPTQENKQGYFHTWGVDYEEFEAGPGNFSTGIVEDLEGNVFEVFPDDIRFTK